MRVAYLGPAGTFSEEAARTAGAGAELWPRLSVPDVVAAVAAGEADRGIVPIENAIEGAVGSTLDTLAAEPAVAVVGEVVLPIALHLVARAPLALVDVTRVLSHPQPLAQSARFLRSRLPVAEQVPAASTADAVRQAVQDPAGARWAAIGPRRAADLYGAVVLAEAVEDEPGNATRFVWVGRMEGASSAAPGDLSALAGTAPGWSAPARTSLTFWGEGDQSSGWLVRCLSEFAFRGVNLSKIESRPLRGRLGHYRFFVDCDGSVADGPVAAAVEGLRAHCEEVRVLGSYPASPPGGSASTAL